MKIFKNLFTKKSNYLINIIYFYNVVEYIKIILFYILYLNYFNFKKY